MIEVWTETKYMENISRVIRPSGQYNIYPPPLNYFGLKVTVVIVLFSTIVTYLTIVYNISAVKILK